MSIVTFRLAREAAAAAEVADPQPVCVLDSGTKKEEISAEPEKASVQPVASQPATKPATAVATVKAKPSATVSK